MSRMNSSSATLVEQRDATEPPGRSSDRLTDIAAFGTNPGTLRARAYVPPVLAPAAPLVVVLHGCSQNAADYDRGAGWSQLADEQGFILLYPEQQRANNANLCFNFFSPRDNCRDSGEALSIRQMIEWMMATHDIDERRVYITGLSAGGAMTSVMLSSYPELFAGGAIIAGLPYGAVASAGAAFSRMAGRGYPADAELAVLARDATAHDGPWPDVSVWHGSADSTVHPSNADRIVNQWRLLHGVGDEPCVEQISADHVRRIWRDQASRAVIEQNIITGMGHGTPLMTGPDGYGQAGPYMLDAGVSSTRDIAQFWGLSAHDEPLAEILQAKLDTVIGGTVMGGEIPSGPRVVVANWRERARAVHSGVRNAVGRLRAIFADALRVAGMMG